MKLTSNCQIEPFELRLLPLNECLAKTFKCDDGTIVKGLSVSIHCKIVGYVARELIKRQPQWLRDLLFPEGSELVAAVHDIGKVSPYFQEKLYSAIGKSLGFENLDSEIGGHAAVSQASLQMIPYKYIPEIVGRHHGASPNSIAMQDATIYGGHEWQRNRIRLVDELKTCFNCDWPVIQNDDQANAISGLVCIADWIGSGEIFDKLLFDKCELSNDLIDRAVDDAGFVGFDVKQNLSFEKIFSFKSREIQTKLFTVAYQPGIYILEAPMGIGKTEAALYAAYIALIQSNATGIYFALPTQLTSDKIYDRMNSFLKEILTENCKFRSLLLHSSAWLRDTKIGEEGMPGKEWFNSKKRGLLAPFAVGTVDQALMGVINVKHSFVRTFGLAGKVVILDEVHSYDCYTSTIITKLIQVLQRLGCTVIILSATLTSERRSELLGEKSDEMTYPLISVLPKNEKLSYIHIVQEELRNVYISIRNDVDVLDEVIHKAKYGEQVLWIENTISEAQDRFEDVLFRTENLGIECGLLHSRFQRIDRSKNEDRWVNIFGKDGHAERIKCGRILVGTQVLEQSLDIDADFLVTQICPTDMLLQRIGRLWRHRETDSLRPKTARQEVWILAPELSDCLANSKKWEKTGIIYFPYILYRSLEILQGKQQICLPIDIPTMLRATYIERNEFEELNKQKANIMENREKLSGLARIGFSTIGKTISERATTRYSGENEGNEVLLIKKIISNNYGTVLTLLNNEILLLPKKIDKSQCREISMMIQKNVVGVPDYLAPKTKVGQIRWLKNFIYLNNSDNDDAESEFCVAIVKDDHSLCKMDNTIASRKFELSYTSTLGYHSRKIERERI